MEISVYLDLFLELQNPVWLLCELRAAGWERCVRVWLRGALASISTSVVGRRIVFSRFD